MARIRRELLLVTLSAVLLLSRDPARASAGIINSLLQAHTRYSNQQHLGRPQVAPPAELMNASASTLVEQLGADYQSPINRIMELIGHKPAQPLVVMQSGHSQQRQVAQEPPVPAPEVSGSRAQQQHWALLGPEGQQQVIQLAEQREQQLLLQHQPQAIAPSASTGTLDSLPEEPQLYQLAPGIENLSDNHHQMALVPYHRAQQQPQEPTQPIFLSSYVPEAARPSPAPAPAPPAVVKVAARVTLPSSIQQANATELEAAEEEQEPEGGENQSSEQQQREAPQQQPSAPEENEAEEPQLSKSEESDELPSGSGSSNYREQYDSDTMEEPARDNTDRGPLSEAESSNQLKLGGLLSVGLNDDCLQCICRASSGCDYHLGCITRGADEKHCGPFQLTEDYWRLAGKPGDQANNFESFEDCANDADCAVETVTNYMKKHHRDCDGDDNITCLDYARLHRLKPQECTKLQNLENQSDYYWAKFQRCAETYNRSRTGDDEDI